MCTSIVSQSVLAIVALPLVLASAMSEEEPSPKRQCLQTIWMKINQTKAQFVKADLEMFGELQDHLTGCNLIQAFQDIVFKHNGIVKELDDRLPDTTVGTPLQLITEVGKFLRKYMCNTRCYQYLSLTEIIRADEEEYHKIVGKPSRKLGDLLLEQCNIRHCAALIEGNAVRFSSEIHTLFGETDYDKPLTIKTHINVSVEVAYLVLENGKFTFNMKANSTIKDVIKLAKPHFQVSAMNGGTVPDKCITVQNNNQEITDWDKLAVDCQLNSPFLISKQHQLL